MRASLYPQYFSLNEVIFFLVLGEEVFVFFDLALEVFKEMLLLASDCDEKKIVRYDNKVTTIGVTENRTRCSFIELWVMRGTGTTG